MTTKEEYKLPLPQPNLDDKIFWDGAKQRKLLVQRCKNCQRLRSFANNPMCPVCHSLDSEAVEASGKGELWSFTTVYHAFGPRWIGKVPFTIGVVKLAEGPRIVSNIIEAAPENLYVGLPVEVVFVDVTPEVTLVKFRPVKVTS